ncbi:flavin-containing monooxygenase [Bordetella bronchiseptica]|uniref:NAD(P)-binding Rossmann-like domain protein n=2 Tax=Bordetella bronchiseptica TaxID=518 RepID=A0ABR4R7X3_BORBO|nr:NAD(P)/FAD-dependent oxidoreductase [Bordetella bronchiseptica]KCV28648.1 NAD(P)-binding Rossmann-like domain protein [Bordetella bronchiseptica 00-P-2730]SHS61997.1 putative flavoprotein involved in K+ transport [Mycobacteroides abscessus subsp. abscessus]AWP83940.1 4-hydroxyacetophenone monooxygenase [Bordetella bronchiseptica]AWQ09505.1 4-hydroxyacetophenone monooxygenase [Bordetella bronchiseptica]AXT90116.1 NAD(P)/FAD-dependent oxidoreductase [Bordetella bronchiseptica]
MKEHDAAQGGTRTETEVLLIGTGFSGLGMAVALKREGRRDFIVLERAGDVGGTWRDNHYPGAACDIQSHLYSYSFRPNPRWSRVYAPQPEILQYLRDTARDEGILDHVRFGANVVRAAWDAAQAAWLVDTTAGRFKAQVLISAAGHLSDPSFPDIEGLASFRGAVFHSANWDHSYDPAGKRIGVIGTGASAIQIVPELARDAGQLTVFQRSAPYVIPRRDHVYSEAEKGLFARFPEAAQELRDELFWGNESRFPQRRQVPAFIEQVTAMALSHLRKQVPDEALRAQLTPHYAIGCKRVLISNDYYPALQQPNVALETAGIARIDEQGVVLKSGGRVDLDLLVVATGFEAAELPIAERIHGRQGRRLSDQWRAGGQAFACTAVSGFPNFFLMLGPNTGLGAGSMIFMVETQINYIKGAVAFIFEHGAIVDPDPDAQRDYVESIYRRSAGTVWLDGGCSSWYLHPQSGKLTTLWPDFMTQFRKENGTFSRQGYQVALRAPHAAEQA